jgi:hypothetical protein
VHLPSLEDMLSTCMNLLQETAAMAFPVTDLLVTMCNHNRGEDCLQVISYLIQHLKSHAGDVPVDDSSPPPPCLTTCIGTE